jgi:CheY-like chemotaxis protein
MDLTMPGMVGLQAASIVRTIEALSDVVIIAFSANVSADRIRQCLDGGCQDFLAKPVQYEALLELLGLHLGLSWVRAEPVRVSVTRALRADASPETLIRPPAEVIAVLADLAAKGRVKTILDEIDRLEKSHHDWAPWLIHVRGLASSFQLKALRDMFLA